MGPKLPFFTDLREAQRYSKSRPYFHPLAIERARKAIDLHGALPLVVDVACGTGQSTKALGALADRVIGLDISMNMLAVAERNEASRYLQARAEEMPFPSGSIPLISCALAFHWFDRDQFFTESWRVLTGDGWLIIYNNGFKGIMRENPSFKDWGWEVYGKRFPTPPRDNSPLTKDAARRFGFRLVGEESYENEIVFAPEELAAYLSTQTNVVAALDSGRETLESAQSWLLDQVSSFFGNSTATFVFGTKAWYLKKQAAR